MADYQLYQSPGQQNQPGGPPPPPPPRPPRKNPYRDGISTSAQHYDLFEMIRHPNVPKANRPPDPPPRPLTPPLSKQQLLELEIEKNFKQQQRRALLASIVKFLFLLLILPPYILLYRLPKFLLVDWIVALANYIDKTLVAIGKAIQNAYNRFKEKIRLSLLSFWNLIKATFKRKMARTQHADDEPMSFLEFLAEGIVALYRVTLYPIVKLAKNGWQLSKRAVKAIRDFPSQLHQAIQKTLKRYHAWRDRLLKLIKTKIFQSIETLKDKTVRPFSRWIDAKILAALAFCRRCKDTLVRYLKAISFAFRHPIQTARLAANAIRTTSQKAYRTLLASIQAKIEALQDLKKRVITYLDSKFIAPVRDFRAQIQAKALLFTAWIKSPYSQSVRLLREFTDHLKRKISALINTLVEPPKRWFKRVAAPFIAAGQAIQALYARIHARVVDRLERLKILILAFLSPFIWATQELWNRLKPLSLPVALSLAAPFIRFYHSSARRLTALVWYIRRLIAWVHILYRYGMEMVRGTAEKGFGLR